MRDGRLIWHRNPQTSNWYVEAHDNPDRLYVLRRCPFGWDATVEYRFAHEPQTLVDWYPILADAKRAADAHHHARILESDDEALKAYVRRFPIR